MQIATHATASFQPFLSPSRSASFVDEREAPSDLDVASRTLSHAVNYLVNEQLAGRRSPITANREAIALLCEAGRSLALVERREPSRQAIAKWLRGSSLVRALRPGNESFN